MAIFHRENSNVSHETLKKQLKTSEETCDIGGRQMRKKCLLAANTGKTMQTNGKCAIRRLKSKKMVHCKKIMKSNTYQPPKKTVNEQ